MSSKYQFNGNKHSTKLIARSTFESYCMKKKIVNYRPWEEDTEMLKKTKRILKMQREMK